MAAALPFLTRDAGMAVTDTLKNYAGPLLSVVITILGESRKTLYPWLSGAYVDATSRIMNQLPNHGKILVAFGLPALHAAPISAAVGRDGHGINLLPGSTIRGDRSRRGSR